MSVSEETRFLFESVMQEIEGLPAADQGEVTLLLEHNEPVIAFETLTTQTYEWELPVTRSAYGKLELIAGRLGLDSDLLSSIRDELVV